MVFPTEPQTACTLIKNKKTQKINGQGIVTEDYSCKVDMLWSRGYSGV